MVAQIRVGGQEARLSDETLPLAFGCIGQETTGPGGFAKALRTVPVVLDVAEARFARCPDCAGGGGGCARCGGSGRIVDHAALEWVQNIR